MRLQKLTRLKKWTLQGYHVSLHVAENCVGFADVALGKCANNTFFENFLADGTNKFNALVVRKFIVSDAWHLHVSY